jgi:dihydrofolate reductase
MMASFWPTAAAMAALPAVAEGMNRMPKVVFSRTLATAEWQYTRLVRDDPAATIRRLKAEAGPDLVVLGSGRIVAQLTEAGLIDVYQIVVNPIVLGAGRTMFEGVTTRPVLTLDRTRSFGNGNVVSWYRR